MRSTILLLTSIFLFCTPLIAQNNVSEPEFVGEVVALKSDGEAILLEKETIEIDVKGMFKLKKSFVVNTPSASVRFKGGEPVRFIVKSVDNAADPVSILDVFRFDAKKKKRSAVIYTASVFSGSKANLLNRVRYTASKYGESSYLITLLDTSAGEFGVMLRNPNNVDEKSTIVSTFAID